MLRLLDHFKEEAGSDMFMDCRTPGVQHAATPAFPICLRRFTCHARQTTTDVSGNSHRRDSLRLSDSLKAGAESLKDGAESLKDVIEAEAQVTPVVAAAPPVASTGLQPPPEQTGLDTAALEDDVGAFEEGGGDRGGTLKLTTGDGGTIRLLHSNKKNDE